METLNGWEIENIEDWLPSLEEMYQIKLEDRELIGITDMNGLCDLIIQKINLENIETCTTQHVFYKLRKIFDELHLIEKDKLKPETSLELIIPRKNRKSLIKQIGQRLGFEIEIIGSSETFAKVMFCGFGLSIILLFSNWKIGLTGIIVLSVIVLLDLTLGKRLKVKTCKDLVKKIARENYLQVRNSKDTINKNELKELLLEWFSDMAGIDKDRLKKSSFV